MAIDKREKFKQIAERRTVRAIYDLRLIGNLSNRNNYEYTEKDVNKILSTLQAELNELKAEFRNSTSREKIEFSLD